MSPQQNKQMVTTNFGSILCHWKTTHNERPKQTY